MIDASAMPPTQVPLVAVVLLNWNRPADTIDCLSSLDELDYPRVHAIVVDNGSTDGSVDRIRAARPDVEIIEAGRNGGFSGGNNLGVRRALEVGARYVWLLNNDTIVTPGSLSALVARAEADPRVGIVGSVLHEHDAPERVQSWGGGAVNLWLGISKYYSTPVLESTIDYLTFASVLLRREALESAGLLD